MSIYERERERVRCGGGNLILRDRSDRENGAGERERERVIYLFEKLTDLAVKATKASETSIPAFVHRSITIPITWFTASMTLSLQKNRRNPLFFKLQN